LVFVAPKDAAQAERWNAEVFLLMLGKKKPRRLTNFGGYIGQIAVSGDGLHFAVLADPDFSDQPGDLHLHVAKLESSTTLRRVAPDFDSYAGQTVNADTHVGTFGLTPVWSAQNTILCLSQKGGSAGVYEFSLDGTVKVRIEPQLSSRLPMGGWRICSSIMPTPWSCTLSASSCRSSTKAPQPENSNTSYSSRVAIQSKVG
jgi:hypothetical protein